MQAQVDKLKKQLNSKDVKLKQTLNFVMMEEKEIQQLKEELERQQGDTKDDGDIISENDDEVNGNNNGVGMPRTVEQLEKKLNRKKWKIQRLNSQLEREQEKSEKELDIANNAQADLKDQLTELEFDKAEKAAGGNEGGGEQNSDKRRRPRRVWAKPANWESIDFYDIRQHFHCRAHSHDQTKPMPTIEDWNVFRDTYKELVDPNTVFDAYPPTEGYTFNRKGQPPPYYAKHSRGKGRGLFASRLIKRGERVQDGTKSDFQFPDAMAWRKFVFALPRKKACDMIDWSWTQKLEKNGQYKIFSAMNISILMNGGVPNISPRNDFSSKMVAIRDIQKDEELLMDYETYDTVWDEVGL